MAKQGGYQTAMAGWGKQPPAALLIIGKEEYSRTEALNAAVAALVQGSSEAPELLHFSGEKSASPLLEALQSPSLLSSRRLLVVTEADSFSKEALEKLLPYIKKPVKECTLLFSAEAIRKNSIFYKTMESHGTLIELAELKPWEKEKALIPWAIEQAAAIGKRLDSPTAQLLIKRLGSDQNLLIQELKKLSCYVGERPVIEAQDIMAATAALELEDSWKLGEAIFRFDSPSAMRICRHLLDDEEVPLIVLLRQLRSQFQTDARLASMIAAQATSSEISGAFPYMRGNLLDRHLAVAREYGLQRLLKGLAAIDDLELASKSSSSSLPPRLLMEALIAKLTTK